MQIKVKQNSAYALFYFAKSTLEAFIAKNIIWYKNTVKKAFTIAVGKTTEKINTTNFTFNPEIKRAILKKITPLKKVPIKLNNNIKILFCENLINMRIIMKIMKQVTILSTKFGI